MFYLLWSANTFVTSPVNANRAMAFGSTIKLLKRSDKAHTRSFPPIVPRKMNTSATSMNGFTAFSPNNHWMLILAKRFHPRIVENAKKNKQTATKIAPKLSP